MELRNRVLLQIIRVKIGENTNFRLTTDSWKNEMTRKQKGIRDSERRKEEGEKREKRFLVCGNSAIRESVA